MGIKSRTICTYLHVILDISLTFLYVNHFWISKVAFKLSGDVEKNPEPKLPLAKVAPFVTGI